MQNYKSDLQRMKETCQQFKSTISELAIWNMNLDEPSPEEISKNNVSWRLFAEDVEHFLKKYSIREAEDIRRLLHSEHINEQVIDGLTVILHKMYLDSEENIPQASTGIGLVLRWEKDGKPYPVRVEISEDGYSRRIVPAEKIFSSPKVKKAWEEFWQVLTDKLNKIE